MKKHLMISLLTLTFSTSVIAAAVNPQGTYFCQSIEVGTHQLYTGTMTIKKTGATYTTSSKFSDGSTYKGTGIFDAKAQILVTAAINTENKDEIGVGLNTFKDDGAMSVKWTYLNRVDVSTAHCKKKQA